MIVFEALLFVVILLFGLTAFIGAPYVPAHTHDVERGLTLLNLPPDSVVVDLGSGDGKILLQAAKRGLFAVGYEINPLLCLVALIRCRPYGKRVKIYWRDFWSNNLPSEAEGVFIFAAGPFMKRLARKFAGESLNRQKPFRVVSYGFALPGQTPLRHVEGFYLYQYGHSAKRNSFTKSG